MYAGEIPGDIFMIEYGYCVVCIVIYTLALRIRDLCFVWRIQVISAASGKVEKVLGPRSHVCVIEMLLSTCNHSVSSRPFRLSTVLQSVLEFLTSEQWLIANWRDCRRKSWRTSWKPTRPSPNSWKPSLKKQIPVWFVLNFVSVPWKFHVCCKRRLCSGCFWGTLVPSTTKPNTTKQRLGLFFRGKSCTLSALIMKEPSPISVYGDFLGDYLLFCWDYRYYKPVPSKDDLVTSHYNTRRTILDDMGNRKGSLRLSLWHAFSSAVNFSHLLASSSILECNTRFHGLRRRVSYTFW